MKKHLAYYLCFLLMLLSVSGLAQTYNSVSADKTTGKIAAPANLQLWSVAGPEYWVTSKPNPTGNGTLANPFDGSTQPKFDAIMRDLIHTNAYKTIHLGPGTYITYGVQPGVPPVNSWVVESNTRIIGAGKDITTIKNRDTLLGGEYVISAGGITADNWGLPMYVTNVVVEDMTLDANGSHQTYHSHPTLLNYEGSGIVITGYRCTLRRVKVIHCIGTMLGVGPQWDAESMPIMQISANPPVEQKTDTDILVENCEVIDSLGNYISAIAVSSGTIQNCRVYFTIVTNGVTPGFNNLGALSAYNCAPMNCRVINNYSYGGHTGFYSDSFACTNLIVRGNTFEEVHYGVSLNHGGAGATPLNNVIIADNIIKISKYGRDQFASGGVSVYSDANVGLIISGNIIYGGDSLDNAIFLHGTTSTLVRDNMWDDSILSFSAYSDGRVGLTLRNNINFAGRLANCYDYGANITYLQDENIIQKMVVTVNNTQLQYYQSGFIVSNSGASGSVTCLLWPAIVGANYTFRVETAQNFLAQAYGTEKIRYAGNLSSAGGTIKSSTPSNIGSSVHIFCAVPGQWVVDEVSGTWTVQ